MFQFTTTKVINNIDQVKLLKKKISDNNYEAVLRFVHVMDFKPGDNIPAVWIRAKQDAVFATATFSMDSMIGEEKDAQGNVKKVAIPGLYQVYLNIGLSNGSQNSLYARSQYYMKGKPIFYSFELDGTETATTEIDTKKNIALKIEAAIKFLQNKFNDKFIKVEVIDGATAAKVKISGTDEFQYFAKAEIQMYGPKVDVCSDHCECSFEKIANAYITENVESFGTYDQILKDLRLPTLANLRYKSINAEEMPVLGATYDQFTVDFVCDRGVMGQSVVGELTKSATKHVFFVNSAISASVEALFMGQGTGASAADVTGLGLTTNEVKHIYNKE